MRAKALDKLVNTRGYYTNIEPLGTFRIDTKRFNEATQVQRITFPKNKYILVM